MLRNLCGRGEPWPNTFLNEVLSLNAQEFRHSTTAFLSSRLLNEVLSLNAQEFRHSTTAFLSSRLLNEVLSLNAQELLNIDDTTITQLSSMKS